MGFLPFFPQLGETIPCISWTQVFSADQAVHSGWVQQEAQGPSKVCASCSHYSRALEEQPYEVYLVVQYQGDSFPSQQLTMAARPVQTDSGFLQHTLSSLTTLTELSRDWGGGEGMTGIYLEAALAALWHRVGVVALPHAKLTPYHSSMCYTSQFAVFCFVTGKTDT